MGKNKEKKNKISGNRKLYNLSTDKLKIKSPSGNATDNSNNPKVNNSKLNESSKASSKARISKPRDSISDNKRSIKELSKESRIKAKRFNKSDNTKTPVKKIETLPEEELEKLEELDKLKKEYKDILFRQKIFRRKARYNKGMSRKEIEKDLRNKFKSTEKKIFLGLFFVIIAAVFAIMLLQIKTIDKADIKNIETLREVDLKSETSIIRQKNKEIAEKIYNTEQSIEKYSTSLKENSSTEKLLGDELKAAELLLGYTEVKGEGIIIQLRDNQYEDIDNNDILTLINKLWTEGAEAISVNDERIVLNSDVALVEGSKIYINSKRIFSPYTVKAIGNTRNLENAVTSKNGYINGLMQNNKTVSYSIEEKVEVPKYKGEIKFKYGK